MLSGSNVVKHDVLDESLDERVAPSLGGVVIGLEHKIYTDPAEFFKRTLITESMAEVLENVANVVSEGRGSKIIVLCAFFGGGKTHTLISLYHAIKNPESLRFAHAETKDIKDKIESIIERLKGVDVVVVDGSIARLSPSPINPLDVGVYRVNTLWGFIAYALGRYDDFKNYDQNLLPPQIDDIVKLLSGRRLVVIIDELAQYIQTLYGAGSELAQNYAKNVVTFFERFVKAVETLSNVALVISLPMRSTARGEEYEIESIYQTDIVYSLVRSIQRVVARYIEPVKPKDIPTLLKVRLFDKVDTVKAKEVEDVLRLEYNRNKNVFGDVRPDILMRIRDSYPFHPLYIDVLLDILDKHRGLQKTRDLIRISRKVVRAVINDQSNVYDLVMPWHIDVERDDIRNLLLSSDYEVFRLPVEEDIVRRCSGYEKPWIAKAVAKALFVKTFVYGGGLVPKVEFFPTPSELALLTYEPGVFRSRDAQPKDVAEAVEWIANNLLYVLKDEKTQRLWFTYIMSPIKYIESIAQKVTDVDAYRKVLKAVEDLLTEPVESIIEKRRKKESIKVFDTELSRVDRECKPIDFDARKYIVYTCLELDITRKKDVLEEIVYRTNSGSTRRYANTVYIVYPDHRERLSPAINYAKKVIACEEAKREDLVDSLLRELGVSVQELEIAREVYRRKIDRYCEAAMLNFYNSIVGALTKLAYPVMKGSTRTVEETDLYIKTTSIVFGVEETLSREGLKKVRRDLDYDTFRFLLNSIGVDLNSAPRRVGDIIDYFYSNPKLPAVSEEVIKEAIAEGVRKLEIGLRCGNRVYFKKIYSCESEEKCLEIPGSEGETMASRAITDDCEVLPYVEALKAQMEGLEGREWIEDGAKVVEDYYVVLEGKLISVKDVLRNFDVFDPDTLREIPLVKLVRKLVIYLEPKESSYRVKPGQEIQHKLIVRRSGPFVGVLHIRSSYGDVEPKTITVDERFTEKIILWRIEAPKEPGHYDYVIEVVSEDGKVIASARIDVFVESIVKEWIEGVPQEGTEIEAMEVVIEGRELKPLSVLKNRLGGSVTVREARLELSSAMREDRISTINITMNNVGLEDVLVIVSSVVQRFMLGKVSSKIYLMLVSADGRSFKMPTLNKDEIDALSKHTIRYKPVGKS